MSKSHVSMEQHQCPICGKTHDTGSLLLDRRLRPVFDRHTVTGRSPCPECAAQLSAGFVALIACNEATKQPTGEYAFLSEEAWGNVFTAPVPPGKICLTPSQTLDTLRLIQAGESPSAAFNKVNNLTNAKH